MYKLLNCSRLSIVFSITLLLLGNAFSTFSTPNIIHDYYTRFLNYSSQNGLSHDKITDIVQDQDGFIWIATANGLNRFDGFDFKQFLNNPNDSTSLSNNYITSLCIDTKNTLWIGTKNGINHYNTDTESFESTPELLKWQKNLSSTHIRKIYNNDATYLWIDCADGILNKVNLISGAITCYKHQKIGYDYYDYHDITMDHDNRIWFGGRSIGPYVLDTLSGNIELIEAGKQQVGKKRDQDIACILQDKDLNYWMSATDGFYRYDIDSNYYTKLLATSTFDIIEDTKESLWLGSGGGLFHYNKLKNSFILYQHNANDNQSIIHNHINCVLKDNLGNIWLGTAAGISILTKRNNLFRHYRHIPENNASLSAERVSSFLKDSENQVWIGTMDHGINLWDRNNELFVSSNTNPKLKLLSNRVSNLYLDKQNNIWIAQWSGLGFSKLNPKTYKVTNYTYAKNTLKRDWYSCFYEDYNKNLWVGFWGANGIHFFDREKEVFEPHDFNTFELPGDFPTKQLKVIDNKVWLYASPYTISLYNPINNSFQSYNPRAESTVYKPIKTQANLTYAPFNYFSECNAITPINNSLYFATNKGLLAYRSNKFEVIPILENQNITAATKRINNNDLIFSNTEYIARIAYNSKKTNVLLNLQDSLSILFNKKVQALYCDSNNTLFIGTNAGLYRYSVINNSLSQYKLNGKHIDNNIIKLYNDGAQNLWILTKDELYIADKLGNENALHKHISKNNTHLNDYLYCLSIQDDNKRIWFGTNKGLVKLNLTDSSFTQIKPLKDIEILNIEVFQDSILYLGSQIGLIKYNCNNNTITYLNQIGKHRLSSRLTSFIFEDKQGYLWIGTTNKGVNRLDTSNFSIQHYIDKPYAQNKFFGTDARCICQLKDGQIWIGGDGINIYDEKNNAFSQFSSKDGLLSDEILGIIQDKNEHVWITTPAGIIEMLPNKEILNVYGNNWGISSHKLSKAFYKLDDHCFLIGSDQGFYSFDPVKVSNTKHSSSFEFSEFFIFDEMVKSNFNDNEPIRLKHNQNFFSLSFTDFDFANTSDRFIYKLKGVDKNWVAAKGNTATYTKISPGKYTFYLSSVYFKDKPSEITKQIQIIISPPFWKTWWFICIEFLAFGAFLLYFYRQRIKQFKMREKQLELEQKLLRSEMNPHFVFNALIAIQSYIFKNKAHEAGRYLSKFAKLMRLFLQNTRQKFIPIAQEIETLEYYVEMQKLRFSNSFGFKIVGADAIETEFIGLPPMMIQPFIENAIEHGFNGIDYCGEIKVVFAIVNPTTLKVIIDDNGIGIHHSKKETKHESLATKITHERLATFDKKGRYKLSIQDKKLINEGSGTLISITLPIMDIDD